MFKRNLDLMWKFCCPINLVSKGFYPNLNVRSNHFLGLLNSPEWETYLHGKYTLVKNQICITLDIFCLSKNKL